MNMPVSEVFSSLPLLSSEVDFSWRLPLESDVEELTVLCKDPDILRFTTLPYPYSRQDALDSVLRAHTYFKEGSGLRLLTFLNKKTAGSVGAKIDWANRSAELGYYTAPWARRKGVTAASLHALCLWLFEEQDMVRVHLSVSVENTGSIRVAEKLGFTLEGTLRKAFLLKQVDSRLAYFTDMNVYSLLPDELCKAL